MIVLGPPVRLSEEMQSDWVGAFYTFPQLSCAHFYLFRIVYFLVLEHRMM
jgi:hypothetical protein